MSPLIAMHYCMLLEIQTMFIRDYCPLSITEVMNVKASSQNIVREKHFGLQRLGFVRHFTGFKRIQLATDTAVT